ncbi:EAL domain-containing protein [Vibrio sp. YMD68]|uniref:EAL domain-containing protein n=1 Tax=Vibrio sp. YMD68 TaxID=3042300 RepID=UPI00249A7610|nr:EAL domain-containing protein [Vibrio sp. YMD68]WGV97976.1 EAL domain-containing protein [Vibrio sp. YMD68]
MTPIKMVTRRKISLFLLYLAPTVLVTATVAVLTVISVRETVRTLGDGYAQSYSRILFNVSMENKSALVAPRNCRYQQQVLRYEREILEMQIISREGDFCSSLGGVGSLAIIDIEQLGDASPMIKLVPIPRSKDISVAVINKRSSKGKEYYAVSLINLDYLRASLGYRTESRIDSASLFIGDDVAPIGAVRESGLFVYTAKVDIPEHEIQIVASNSLIKEKIRFYFLASIPGTLMVYFGFYFFRRVFIRHQGFHNELKRALKQKEFILHYQPLVDARTGEMYGVEALVRWIHPERGLIYPDVFIPALEEFELIDLLTEVVVEKAVSDFSNCSFSNEFHLGINFPPGYFLSNEHREYLIEQAQTLKDRGIRLGLEITERQLLDRQAKSVIEHLRKFGLDVLIDDFGTGQTSLAMLETTAIDYLKIDKCFVDTIGFDSVNAPVLDAIISMAQALNLNLIAEGVEDKGQALYLLEKGVVYHQGYLYSKPVAFDELNLP